MPPKPAKKQKEDTEEVEVVIVESISPFEKKIMDRMDKNHGTLEDISKNVSKLTKHLIKLSNNENTAAKEVASEANDATAEILKEMSATLKNILKAKTDTITNTQPAELPESTQILIEQEAKKLNNPTSKNGIPSFRRELQNIGR